MIAAYPTYFALNRIRLGDRTNFLRAIRFYVTAISYYFVILASARIVSKQPILSSDLRLLLYSISAILLFWFAYFATSRLFFRGGVSFGNVAHIGCYVFAAANAFSGLYFAAFAIFEHVLTLNGLSLFPEVLVDPYLSELNKCLAKDSLVYDILVGTDPAASVPVPIFIGLVRGGFFWSLFFSIPASRIFSALFGFPFLKSLLWLVLSTVLAFVAYYAVLVAAVIGVALQTDCSTEAYYEMGKQDSQILLGRIQRQIGAELPMNLGSSSWIRVEARSNELVYYFELTGDMNVPMEKLEKIQRNSAVQGYCYSAFGIVDYEVALRRLGIPIRRITDVNHGQMVIDTVAGPTDCEAGSRAQ